MKHDPSREAESRQLVKDFLPFMGIKCSCSKEPTIGVYSAPVQSSPHSHALFLQGPFKISSIGYGYYYYVYYYSKFRTKDNI